MANISFVFLHTFRLLYQKCVLSSIKVSEDISKIASQSIRWLNTKEFTNKFRLLGLNIVLNRTMVSERTTIYFDQSKMNSNHMLESPDTTKC